MWVCGRKWVTVNDGLHAVFLIFVTFAFGNRTGAT
jgi:hypothetical protein